MTAIVALDGLEILDSRGNPTLEVRVACESGVVGTAKVPSGASTGEQEAVELRDRDAKRYGGLGVTSVVRTVGTILAESLVGHDVTDQAGIDGVLCQVDGTENKHHLGANALLGVSLACAYAAAEEAGLPLYRYIGGSNATILPVPMMNVINGGKHAENTIDFQEFMIVPVGADSFAEALRYGAECFHALKRLLHERSLATGQGDEGGFAPDLPTNEAALDLLVEAITGAGFQPGKDVFLALDPAVSELWDGASREYVLKGEGVRLSSEALVERWKKWTSSYPIISLEDGMAEDDWEGWAHLTREIGDSVQLVGDDVFVTNPVLIEKGIRESCANAVLIKVNQIGTLSETFEAMRIAREAGYRCVVSHRSGETEDTTIADLAVATGCGQIKTGAPSRSERVAKYNRLLRIEHDLGDTARFLGRSAFRSPARKGAPAARV